jgi:hypothetical protein
MAVTLVGALSGCEAWGSVGPCTNESLRPQLNSEQLPDCRAYERVTPAYKESEPAELGNVFAVSLDGSRLIYGNVGAFGGAEEANLNLDSNVANTAYLSERGSRGWTTVSLAPRASEYVSNGSDGLYDASATLESSLWEFEPMVGGTESSTSFEGHSSFYLEHDPVVGKPASFEKIGSPTPTLGTPNVSKYKYLGASSELSHVLFSILPGYRWPFDTTIKGKEEKNAGGTLYEYIGTESPSEVGAEPSGEPERKPILVGVSGGLGSPLISNCGTRLGSSSLEENLGSSSLEEKQEGSAYNAISEKGERIFFTAVGAGEAHEVCDGPQVAELFVREEVPQHEGELPAAVQQTVPISEPSREACAECLHTDKKAASFQGASLDGSKAFFTTEQELLPGVKGNNLYEYDFDAPAGEHVALVSDGSVEAGVQGVSRISEDGSHVYFVAKGELTSAANEYGEKAKEGEDNLYVYQRDAVYPEGHVAFVADLVPGPEKVGGDEADWQFADDRPVLTSEEGKYLVFTSAGDLAHEGVELGKRQVFQYNTETETLVRASIGQDGYSNDNRTPLIGATITSGALSTPDYINIDSPTLIAGTQAPTDGAVFFSSPDALVRGALSDQYDIAEQYDRDEERLVPNIYEYRAGQVYLLSDGSDRSTINGEPGTKLSGWNSTGQNVFFFTSDPLVPADEDTQSDLYDARENGGFPTSTPAPDCHEACQGGLTPAPALALPQSDTQAAEAESSQVSPPVPAASGVKQKPAKHKSKSHKKRKGGGTKNKKKVRGVVPKHTARSSANRNRSSEGSPR